MTRGQKGTVQEADLRGEREGKGQKTKAERHARQKCLGPGESCGGRSSGREERFPAALINSGRPLRKNQTPRGDAHQRLSWTDS